MDSALSRCPGKGRAQQPGEDPEFRLQICHVFLCVVVCLYFFNPFAFPIFSMLFLAQIQFIKWVCLKLKGSYYKGQGDSNFINLQSG